MLIDLMTDQDTDDTPSESWVYRMRKHRNRLLVESDWSMVIDSPADKTVWASYRETLRDFPATWVAGSTVEFPDLP